MDEHMTALTTRLLENDVETLVARRDAIAACIESLDDDARETDAYERALRVGATDEGYIREGLTLLLAAAEREVAEARAALARYRGA